MAMQMNTRTGARLKVASAEVKRQEPEGPLFYILPPALVLAVIIFCHCATPPADATEKKAPTPAASVAE